MKSSSLNTLHDFDEKRFTDGLSPFAKWLNGKVISIDKKTVDFEFKVRKEMTNPVGFLHGGVISGMIDVCMGSCVSLLGLKYFCPTINLHVEFLNPALEGDTVIVKAQIIKQGNKIINIIAQMFNESNKKIVAQASSNLVVSNIKSPIE